MNLDSLIYGGEFPLDLKKTIKFRNLKILNKGSYTLSGRSALYLIIKHLSKNRIRNAILPHLICKSVNDVFKNEGLKLFYYEINKNFEPVINNFFQINNSIILVNHYFGLVNNNINNGRRFTQRDWARVGRSTRRLKLPAEKPLSCHTSPHPRPTVGRSAPPSTLSGRSSPPRERPSQAAASSARPWVSDRAANLQP